MRRLTALLAALLLLAFTGCAANPAQPESISSPAQADETQADFQVESAYPLEYAKEFTVDECTGGTRLITIQNARYLVVPENGTVPNGLSEDITVLQNPLENVYLVSTSAMDPILKLDARSAVTLSGTSAENWYLPEAKEAMENGVVAGYPMVDIGVTVYDGSYHEVDSSEMAFKIAGSMGFKSGAAKADPVLLEPYMKVEVTVPEEYMGDVIGDLNSRRGRIEGMEARNGAQIISAFVPLSEMFGYATDLRSKTQGRGNYSMEVDHYEEVPRNIAEAIIAKNKGTQA